MSIVSQTDLILKSYDIPEKGKVEFNVNFTLDINVTAKEAKLQAGLWLHQNVSHLIATDPPTLVIGERVVWRIPAWIGFPHTGRVDVVGEIDVDVETGEMGDLDEKKAEILRRLEDLKPRVPLYKPPQLNSEYLAENVK
jgi:hypothetical protein